MAISVLMSIYKKEKTEYFKASMESILAQTYPVDEIVLIQDGPLTEELDSYILELQRRLNEQTDANTNGKTPRLVTYSFPENVQLGRALAKGVELCSNEYIARMDTDDIAKPYRMEHQIKYMEQHPEIAALGGEIEEFNDNNTKRQIKHMPTGTEQVKRYARYRNPMNHMTVMFRKSAVLQADNYEHYPNLEDYYLWIRMLAHGKQIDNLPEVLVEARTNEDFYGKRGGIEYWKRYLVLRKIQHQLKLTTWLEYWIACVLTTGVVASSSKIRKIFYQTILRR